MPLTTPELCLFCRRLRAWDDASPPSRSGTDPDLIWRFPHSVVVLGSWQYFHGYCVLISRTHAEELSQLDRTIREAFLAEMCLLAEALEEEFRPRKLNYELLGNQVPHLHWHLFPRYAEDPGHLKPVWVAIDRAEGNAEEQARLTTGPCPREETARRITRRLLELTGR